CHCRIFGAEQTLADPQGALIQRLGIRGPADFVVHLGEIVRGRRRSQVVGAEPLLENPGGLLEHRRCFGEWLLRVVQHPERVEGAGQARIVLAQLPRFRQGADQRGLGDLVISLLEGAPSQLELLVPTAFVVCHGSNPRLESCTVMRAGPVSAPIGQAKSTWTNESTPLLSTTRRIPTPRSQCTSSLCGSSQSLCGTKVPQTLPTSANGTRWKRSFSTRGMPERRTTRSSQANWLRRR